MIAPSECSLAFIKLILSNFSKINPFITDLALTQTESLLIQMLWFSRCLRVVKNTMLPAYPASMDLSVSIP